MLITRIWGGLGNQMFQYATGYGLSKRLNQLLYLDTSFFSGIHDMSRFTPRTLDLDRLPIEEKRYITDIRTVSKYIDYAQNKYANYLLRKIGISKIRLGNIDYYLETKYKYHPELMKIQSKNIYLDGYWHCEKYFFDYRESIYNQFCFTNEKINDELGQIGIGDTVAIHIRRGDYLTDNNPNMMHVEYYRDAMKLIGEKLGNPIFCFFSDDLDWVKQEFGNTKHVRYINERRLLTDEEELQVMRSCKHNIISNSSFSWWGAWLNSNVNKIVIAPRQWKDKEDMMPNTWLRL